MPAEAGRHRHRAFLTCASRARSSLAPLLAAVEQRLHDLGWSTRIPRRAPAGGGLATAERRRLRLSAYADVEHCAVTIHVPAGALLAGVALHRELAHAAALRRPVLIVVVPRLRAELGIEAPSPARLAELVDRTEGRLLDDLDALEAALRWA